MCLQMEEKFSSFCNDQWCNLLGTQACSSIDNESSMLKHQGQLGTGSDGRLPQNLDVLRTPDKPPLATTPAGTARNRFGWAMKNDNGSNARKTTEDTGNTFPSTSQLLPLDRGTFTTPRICKTIGRTFSLNSECSSTQSTPNKSVCKPFNPALGGNRAPSSISHAPSSALCSKHNPLMANTVDVPHFEMKEDPSFWMDHNVHVILIFYPV